MKPKVLPRLNPHPDYLGEIRGSTMFQYKWTSDHLDSVPILTLRPTITYTMISVFLEFTSSVICLTRTDKDGFRWNIARGADCYMIGG